MLQVALRVDIFHQKIENLLRNLIDAGAKKLTNSKWEQWMLPNGYVIEVSRGTPTLLAILDQTGDTIRLYNFSSGTLDKFFAKVRLPNMIVTIFMDLDSTFVSTSVSKYKVHKIVFSRAVPIEPDKGRVALSDQTYSLTTGNPWVSESQPSAISEQELAILNSGEKPMIDSSGEFITKEGQRAPSPNEMMAEMIKMLDEQFV